PELEKSDFDLWMGTADKTAVFDRLAENSPQRNQVGTTRGFLPTTFYGSARARASLKIQDGCNFKCSFCIIPQARGRSRSLTPDEVLQLVSQAQEAGYEEVVLTGIHLAHYGWDQKS